MLLLVLEIERFLALLLRVITFTKFGVRKDFFHLFQIGTDFCFPFL